MDDTADFDAEPLGDGLSTAAPGSDRRPVAGGPDRAVPDPRGATVASQGLNRSAPDAGPGDPGVATAFEYRLHRVGPQVLAGPVLYPAEQAGQVLRRYRDWAA